MPKRTINWILNFHGIGESIRPFDPGEEHVWVSESRFLSILDRVCTIPDIEITFDDGNISDVLIALPALLERGLKASFFIPVGKIGHKGFVDEHQLCELHTQGMTIGSHGWAHQSWRGMSSSESKHELVDSRHLLESVLGVEVLLAACPFGAYDRLALKRIRAAGYSCAYTSDRGYSSQGDFLRARNTVISTDSVDEVFSKRDRYHFGFLDMVRRVVKKVR